VTFGEARTILRNDILAELSTNYFQEEELLRYLLDSARELALAHQFPTDISAEAVAQDATAFTPTAGESTISINEMAFDGFEMKLVPLATVLQYRGLREGVRRIRTNPRYYSWDTRRGGNVEFAPAAPRAGTITYEAVVEYDTTGLGADDDMWDGQYAAFHYLIVYRAAAKAFEASLEQERASYYLQRMMALQQEFSVYLKQTPLASLVVASATAGERQ
jgi:aryl carrier-like protein